MNTIIKGNREDQHSCNLKIEGEKGELFAYHSVKTSSLNLTGIKVMIKEEPINEA